MMSNNLHNYYHLLATAAASPAHTRSNNSANNTARANYDIFVYSSARLRFDPNFTVL
jgi:hypothetical protein